MQSEAPSLSTDTPRPGGHYRWTVCALLFFATTINYIDRQVLGILKPVLMEELKWNEIDFSNVVLAFQIAYAAGLASFGWFIDKYGTKIGYSISIIGWSLAAMGHAFARTVFGFGVARAALGAFEGGNFPNAIKTVAEWFPKKERALVTGIFNSGCNVGAIICPAVVPWLAVAYGWKTTFLVTGMIGFSWLIFWILLYEKPEHQKRLKAQELAYIHSDPPESAAKIPWLYLLRYRQTWAFVIGKFMTDPVWWFYLYWLPGFLYKQHSLSITELGLPLIVIYLIADVGSIGGGWLSSHFIKMGWSVNKSRKVAMLICALCVVPVISASRVSDLWTAVLLIGVAAGAHQAWSANMFTTASDMFPKRAVGSMVGLGGMAGSVGGMLFSPFIGHVLEYTHNNYLIPFLISGSAYLVALGIMHAIVPRLQPAKFD